MVFLVGPLRPLVWNVALISPSPPGGIASVETTVAVQPHEPLARRIIRSPTPSFRILKVCSTALPCLTFP